VVYVYRQLLLPHPPCYSGSNLLSEGTPPRTLDIWKYAYSPDKSGQWIVVIECSIKLISFRSGRKLAHEYPHPLQLIFTGEGHNAAEPIWVFLPCSPLFTSINAAAAVPVGGQSHDTTGADIEGSLELWRPVNERLPQVSPNWPKRDHRWCRWLVYSALGRWGEHLNVATRHRGEQRNSPYALREPQKLAKGGESCSRRSEGVAAPAPHFQGDGSSGGSPLFRDEVVDTSSKEVKSFSERTCMVVIWLALDSQPIVLVRWIWQSARRGTVLGWVGRRPTHPRRCIGDRRNARRV